MFQVLHRHYWRFALQPACFNGMKLRCTYMHVQCADTGPKKKKQRNLCCTIPLTACTSQARQAVSCNAAPFSSRNVDNWRVKSTVPTARPFAKSASMTSEFKRCITPFAECALLVASFQSEHKHHSQPRSTLCRVIPTIQEVMLKTALTDHFWSCTRARQLEQ